jgi:hypothetical protein
MKCSRFFHLLLLHTTTKKSVDLDDDRTLDKMKEEIEQTEGIEASLNPQIKSTASHPHIRQFESKKSFLKIK